MRLNDIKSSTLLPMGAKAGDEPEIHERLAWVCSAFDIFVKSVDARRVALSAPYDLSAIQALTDEEMQQYYEEFGLATYYPDISRAARENFLCEQFRQYRKLGTIDAIQAMIQYIFGENPIDLDVVDNLAFDENGVLIDSSLYDMYDAIITAQNPELDAFQISRIFANLTKFNRDSQKLRALAMRYETDMSINAGSGSLDAAMFFDNGWIDCALPVIPTNITIGIDNAIPPGATGLSSEYYCFYNFDRGTDLTNLWYPQYYSDNIYPSNPDPSSSTIPSAYYSNVWIWDGAQVYDLSANGALFRLNEYSLAPEIFTSLSDEVDSTKCACVIEVAPGALVFTQTEFSLPSDLYTISGTTITWDTTHPLYNILYGKTAKILY